MQNYMYLLLLTCKAFNELFQVDCSNAMQQCINTCDEQVMKLDENNKAEYSLYSGVC